MADKKKSVVDEALLDIKVIQEALKKNTKEILRSTMKEEIDELVKEAVADIQGYKEEDIEDDSSEDTDVNDTEIDVEDGETDTDTDIEDDDTEVKDDDTDDDFEISADDEESGDELPVPMDNAPEDTVSDIEDYDEIDMTAASDNEVISVFKKLSADDEIEIVSDNEVKITDPDSGNQYVITLGGSKPSEMDNDLDDNFDSEMGGEDLGDEDLDLESSEPIYEITIDEDIIRTAMGDRKVKPSKAPNTGNIEGQKASMGDFGDNLDGGFTEEDPNGSNDGHAEHVMESEDEDLVDENKSRAQADLHTQRVRPDGKKEYHTAPIGRTNESVSKKQFNELLTIAKKLQNENREVKKALGAFRKMLAESVVYNTNLTYMVKIITEHSTSQAEKQEIMKRFDSVKTLKESKSLYKTIAGEFSNKKPITESITSKIDKKVIGSSSSKLTESTAYVDDSTKKIKDLISRVENKDKY